MEVRCATNSELTEWGDPEFLFNVSYYRAIPYDPSRPWKDADGMWYMGLSADHCNVTTKRLPCESGGEVLLYRSPKLRGSSAEWTKVGPMYTTPKTVLRHSHLSAEFVTIEYIGNLTGDPHNGTTRVFLNNVAGNGGGDCCSGTTSYTVGFQEPPSAEGDGKFTPYLVSNLVNGTGMMDWGSFYLNESSTATYGVEMLSGNASHGWSMARVVGTETNNYVTENGRKVIFAWVAIDGNDGLAGGHGNALSLPRDLSMDKELRLLQQFAPELKVLRESDNTHLLIVDDAARAAGAQSSDVTGQQIEVFAKFTTHKSSMKNEVPPFGFSVLGCRSGVLTKPSTKIGVVMAQGLISVDAVSQHNDFERLGPIQPANATSFAIHAIVDHTIIEVIVNNLTAFTVTAHPKSVTCDEVSLFGVDGVAVTAEMQVWRLRSANNE